MVEPMLPRDLADGLRLRSATPADADALAAFNGRMHGPSPDQPDRAMADWTHDLLTRPHPTLRPHLFTMVEEADSGRIVSTLCLIPQTWSYDGIALGVGRIELVATDPAYRRRGLVRRQMEVVHGWSGELGPLLQAITGIPWYYRQFGYELALDLGGGSGIPVGELPVLARGEPEPFQIRLATLADIPLLRRADDHGRQRSLLTSVRDDAWWHYEIAGRSGAIAEWNRVWVIERTAAGTGIGSVMFDAALLAGGRLLVSACEIVPGVSWLAIAPSLLRALAVIGDELAGTTPSSEHPADSAADEGRARCERLVLRLGADHPLYEALPGLMGPLRRPYAWYVRAPNLPGLLHRVAPALDARLTGSIAAGYSGELRLWCFTSGLRLRFAEGRLAEVTEWPEGTADDASAHFPPLTLLHLICGHRSLTELEDAFADCSAQTDEARVVLNALFPKRPSFVLPLG